MKEYEIENVIKNIIFNEIQPLIMKLSSEFDVTFEQFLYINVPKDKFCIYTMRAGKRKGQRCGDKALENYYCKKHQAEAIKINVSLGNNFSKSKTVEKKVPKSKQEILEWLATAIPQKVTKLKKHKYGYIHEESEIIFENRGSDSNNDYIAIGVISGKKMGKLTNLEIEKCEQMGWKYDYNNVE